MSVRTIFRSSQENPLEGYLSLRIYYKHQSRQIATGLRIREEEWNDSKSSIVLKDFSHERRNYLQRLNYELKNKVFHLHRLLSEYKAQNKGDVSQILAEFRQAAASNSFFSYVNLLAHKLMKQNRFRTAEAYLTVMRRVVRFNCGKDLPLDQLTPDFVEQFERQLISNCLAQNTISFYMRNLRAIYNRAIKDKLLIPSLDNPFGRVYTGVKSTVKRALSKEEINQVYALDLAYVLKKEPHRNAMQKLKELEQARDLFLFSFHARGMSFVDITFLKKSNIKHGILSYNRKKTGQQLDIKISPAMCQIINKYSTETLDSPYVFPIIKSQYLNSYNQYLAALRKQNQNLKLIQELAGVERKITTHVARHTWATIAKEENLPIWTISESLGHSSVKTTYIYLASINRTRLDEANEIVARAVGF